MSFYLQCQYPRFCSKWLLVISFGLLCTLMIQSQKITIKRNRMDLPVFEVVLNVRKLNACCCRPTYQLSHSEAHSMTRWSYLTVSLKCNSFWIRKLLTTFSFWFKTLGAFSELSFSLLCMHDFYILQWRLSARTAFLSLSFMALLVARLHSIKW